MPASRQTPHCVHVLTAAFVSCARAQLSAGDAFVVTFARISCAGLTGGASFRSLEPRSPALPMRMLSACVCRCVKWLAINLRSGVAPAGASGRRSTVRARGIAPPRARAAAGHLATRSLVRARRDPGGTLGMCSAGGHAAPAARHWAGGVVGARGGRERSHNF